MLSTNYPLQTIGTNRMKVKECENIFHAKRSQQRSRTQLISGKSDFKTKAITRAKKDVVY